MERLVRGCPLLESLIMMSCGLTNVGIRSIAQVRTQHAIQLYYGHVPSCFLYQ